jgi:hypothetical protein
MSAPLVTSGPWVDLGAFHEIQHRKNRGAQVVIEIQRDRDQPSIHGVPEDVDFEESDKLSLSFGYDKKKNRIRLSDAEFCAGKRLMLRCDDEGKFTVPGMGKRVASAIDIHMHNFFPATRPTKMPKSDAGNRRLYDGMMQIEAQVYGWSDLIRAIYSVPAHRAHVPFFAVKGERGPSEFGMSGAELLRRLASNEPINAELETLLPLLNECVQNFGILKELRIEFVGESDTIFSLVGDDVHGTQGINVAAMGEGVSQLLPIAASILASSPHQIALIEQPEIHLHPALQADVGDLLVSQTARGKRQFVVETHSEHLLLRVRRRLAEGALSPDQVAILYVERSGPESKVRKLGLSDNGQISDWPEGFFSEGYAEALALATAKRRRK